MIFILKNILNFIKNNTAIFVITIAVEIVTLLGVFTAYNYYVEKTEENKSYYQEMRTFAVTLTDTNELEENLSKVLDSGYEIERIYTYTNPYSLNLTKNDFLRYTEPDGTVKERIAGLFCSDYYGESTLKHKVIVGSDIDLSDTENAENEIVLSSDLNRAVKVGEMFNINGLDYLVIGIGTDTSNYIPYNTVIKNNLPIDGLGIVLKNEVDSAIAKKFSAILTDIFKTNSVHLPEGEYGREISDYNKYIIFTCLMLFLSIFNFVYLYSYILDKRKKQYSILRIYGCTKLKGIMIYTIEAIIISSLSYLISVALYLFVHLPVLRMLDKYTFFAMNIDSFLIVFASFILIMLCVVIPSIVKYSKKDIVDQYRD